MTNLQFPSCTFDNLTRIVNGRTMKKIAYATHAIDYGDHIAVLHHGSTIALIEPERVAISNAGWSSKTTAHRLSCILSANNVHSSGRRVSVGISNHEMVLRYFNGSGVMEVPFPDHDWISFNLS